MPTKVGIIIILLFVVIQIVGELLEFKGKVVPEFVKIRKYFTRKKNEKIEMKNTLQQVKTLLNDVNQHYSADNITKRDKWMQWVNERAVVYDTSIVDITQKLSEVTTALNANTKMTEDLFIENSRDRIIDFAEKASDYSTILSHEQFRRIFRVYECYEQFLKEHHRTNGEVNTAYEMIKNGYKYRIQNHCFAEDVNSYLKK